MTDAEIAAGIDKLTESQAREALRGCLETLAWIAARGLDSYMTSAQLGSRADTALDWIR